MEINQKDAGDEAHWIKAEYQKKIKRIFNPPGDYTKFLEVLRVRFLDLHADLEEQQDKQAHIQFYDVENDLIDVETSKDLQEAFLYYRKHDSQRLIKFLVELHHVPIRQSLLEEISKLSAPVPLGEPSALEE